MCLISALPVGTKKDTQEVYDFINSGYNCNKQGSGIMYKRENSKTINIIKGFFDIDNLINTIKKLEFKDNDELVIHHRISTCGKVDSFNCHPFIISNDHDEVILTAGKTKKPCMMHNGVFRNILSFRPYTSDFSDTYAFARHIMSNKNVMNIFKEDKVFFKHVFAEILGNSKIAMMYPDKPLELFGDFTEKNGYFHSNDGYCRVVHNVGGFETKNKYYAYGPYSTYDECESYDDTYYENLRNERLAREAAEQAAKDDFAKKFVKDYKKQLEIEIPDTKVENKGKKSYMILDNSFVKINELNCFHFKYVKKDNWDMNTDIDNIRMYEMSHQFDPETLMTTMCRKESDIKSVYNGFLNNDILNECYYIPKNKDLETVYTDLLKLTTCNIPVSKSTIKKLDKLLYNYDGKTNMSTIMYHRIGKRVTKLSLLLYKEYLNSVKLEEKGVEVLN